MTVTTVRGIPAGYTAALTAQVGSWPTSCDPFKWTHGRNMSVSQKCYVNLPSQPGSWRLTGTATLTKHGAGTLVYRRSKVIKTKGAVTHPSLNQVSAASVRSAIRYGQRANTSPRLLRPPYGAGAYTTRLYYQAKSQGYQLCHWGSDTADWSGVSAATIVNKTVRGDSSTAPVRAGDAVLMHLTNTQTRYALPTLIRSLRAKGLAFDKLR